MDQSNVKGQANAARSSHPGADQGAGTKTRRKRCYPAPAQISALLVSADELAKLLACSPRTITRLSRLGKMPQPRKLGALSRWLRAEIDAWLASGCPATGGLPAPPALDEDLTLDSEKEDSQRSLRKEG